MSTRMRVVLFVGVVLFAVFATAPRQTTIAGSPNAPETIRFRLDAGQSKFIAHGLRGGLLWFKGHEHLIAAREFSGEAEITAGAITPAALRLVVNANSLVETSDAFTEPQKQIINKELKEIVLLPDQYPDITFQSTDVTAKGLGGGRYDVNIKGNLTLHGITRPVTIPATITLNGSTLRAVGKFSIDRDDYKVKATSAFHGMVRVDDDIKFEFDILGRRA